MGEKITKRTKMGDVVKDFYKSDVPSLKERAKQKEDRWLLRLNYPRWMKKKKK